MRRVHGRRLLYPLVATLIAACAAPDDMTDIPIVGGTADQRDAVLEVLTDFQAAAGAGRVAVRTISLRPLKGDVPGHWQPISRRIEIDDGLDLPKLRAVVRHELCHALSSHEGAPYSQVAELYDRTAVTMVAAGAFGDDPGCGTERCLREEAFAGMCELGPFAAAAVAQPCDDDDDPDLAEVMQHMLDTVWLEGDPMPVAAPVGEVVSYDVGAPIHSAFGWSSSDAEVWRLGWTWAEATDLDDNVLVDPTTGEYAFGDPGWGQRPEGHPPGLPDAASLVLEAVGWEQGCYFGHVSLSLHHASAGRHLYTDGDGRWGLFEDGCGVYGSRNVTAWRGQLWEVSAQDTRVTWHPVGFTP